MKNFSFLTIGLAAMLISPEQISFLTVELRYYSAKNAGTYKAATFPYEEETILGSYGRGKGYVPVWK